MSEEEKIKPLRGFAKMKVEDPERFKDVCARAGRRCQKIHVHVRWTREKAKKMSRLGGQARHGVTKIKL